MKDTKTHIGNFTDAITKSNYELVRFENAEALSKILKENLESKGIDYTKYNTDAEIPEYDRSGKAEAIKNPPVEIYEYQNFFLLEQENGNYVLLDGFRRLLWYTAPNSPILVRIYKQSELNQNQILSLLVYLNHFKFHADQNYYDRGFALLLKTIFNLNILDYAYAFNAYLTSDKVKHDYLSEYWDSGEKGSNNVKSRILTKEFISDIMFMEKLNNAGCMVNKFFGAQLYKLRTTSPSYKDKEFNAEQFIAISTENKVLQTLMVKYQKEGCRDSSRSRDIVNQVLEIYLNIFKQMSGTKTENSYAEQMDECKAIVTNLKKDKSLTKLTGMLNVYDIEMYMIGLIKSNQEIKFKCVVHPNHHKQNPSINIGLTEDVFFKGFHKSKSWGSREEPVFVIKSGKHEFTIRHNYGGYNSYGKKYVKAECQAEGFSYSRYDIDLFVCIPQSISKGLFDKRINKIKRI